MRVLALTIALCAALLGILLPAIAHPLGENRKSADSSILGAVEEPLGMNIAKEYPADNPDMSEIESLLDDVAVCTSEYGKQLILCNNKSKSGELSATLDVLYRLRCARARLCWAESRWSDCRNEALAAVSTAKALMRASVKDRSDDENLRLLVVSSQAKLTEARILLANVDAKIRSSTKGQTEQSRLRKGDGGSAGQSR
jgi:hypothetical protein